MNLEWTLKTDDKNESRFGEETDQLFYFVDHAFILIRNMEFEFIKIVSLGLYAAF